MKAYILITTKPGTSEQVVKSIKAAREVKGVVMADSVFGKYDAVVVIEAPDMEKISSVVYRIVENIPNIVHTETALTVF